MYEPKIYLLQLKITQNFMLRIGARERLKTNGRIVMLSIKVELYSVTDAKDVSYCSLSCGFHSTVSLYVFSCLQSCTH